MFWRLFGRKKGNEGAATGRGTAAKAPTEYGAVTLDTCTFAVVDVETTGLFPNAHDRIVEIAIIQVGGDGQPLDEFITLVNPDRDVGPTRIHGIATRDILGAPRFADIAGDIAARLGGHVIVAHNARFDAGFLQAEFGRIGIETPPLVALCTLGLARRVVKSAPSYRLGALCERLGIPLDGAHSALGDARATAGLLALILSESERNRWVTLADLGCPTKPAPPSAWPRLSICGLTHTRQHASREPVEPPHLARLIDRLATTPVHHDAETMEYVDLLDRVLEDRRVTTNEAQALWDVATRWGLSKEQVSGVHQAYMEALVAEAAEDGAVTDAERRDLDRVAELLGYSGPDMDAALARTSLATGSAPDSGQASPSRESFTGFSVCFTGESRCTLSGKPISRDRAEQLAVEAGLIVAKSVTKRLDLLVVADPHSLSGKARKAREYGTRIVAEEVFWRTLGISVN